MIMDCEKYVGKCVCGREHELETKKVVVESGAIANFEQYMADVGLADKKRAVVYDSVIYKLTEGKHVRADQEIVLEANGLKAEDVAIEKMMEQLDDPEVIVAYGAGTIMDFGRVRPLFICAMVIASWSATPVAAYLSAASRIISRASCARSATMGQ